MFNLPAFILIFMAIVTNLIGWYGGYHGDTEIVTATYKIITCLYFVGGVIAKAVSSKRT